MTKEELGQLIMTEQECFYRIAKTMLYEDADCSDAISEAIVKAFDSINTLRKPKYAKTWFVRILINECYAILNRQKRMVAYEPDSLPDNIVSFNNEDYSELYEALEALPPKTRLVISLYYMEGYSVKEIAKLTDTTESAVKNRLLRGRHELKNDLEEMEGA
ncbi:MAG: sigma-70 family RNA polymerase sigma factor [Lachnospiraceae bacterium]|nr:sigma-70 family RNA polymerase sigma factor [Lachnospiraceae bacterium]